MMYFYKNKEVHAFFGNYDKEKIDHFKNADRRALTSEYIILKSHTYVPGINRRVYIDISDAKLILRDNSIFISFDSYGGSVSIINPEWVANKSIIKRIKNNQDLYFVGRLMNVCYEIATTSLNPEKVKLIHSMYDRLTDEQQLYFGLMYILNIL